MNDEDICTTIVDCAYQIHRKVGPGLFESVYHSIMARDLPRRGLQIESKKQISFEYEGLVFENAFVADLVVEGKVVVEIKSVAALAPAHYKQLLTYLRLLNLRFGFLINFGAPLFKSGIKRIVNGW